AVDVGGALARHFILLAGGGGGGGVGTRVFISPRGQSRQPIKPLAVGRRIAIRGERRAADFNLRAGDRRALRVLDHAFDRGRGLGRERGSQSAERQAEKSD